MKNKFFEIEFLESTESHPLENEKSVQEVDWE